MNNCLVTKLKGTVQNNNIPYFGQIALKANGTHGSGSAYTRCFGFWCDATEVINYSFTGTSIALGAATQTPLPLSGTVTGRSSYELITTGAGTLKVWSKYGFASVLITSDFEVDASYLYADTFVDTDFCVKQGSDIHIKGNVARAINLRGNVSNNTINLPVLDDFDDYANLYLDDNINVMNFRCYSNPEFVGGDLNKLLAINNAKPIVGLSINNSNGYISDISKFTPYCKDTCEQFVIARGIVKGDVESELAEWTNLNDLNCFTEGSGIEWAPVFNAWKAAGVASRVVTFYANGTVNGEPIPGHTLAFDSSGNWSIA